MNNYIRPLNLNFFFFLHTLHVRKTKINDEAKCVSLLVSCEMEEWINGWIADVRDYLHGVPDSSYMYSNTSLTAIMLSASSGWRQAGVGSSALRAIAASRQQQ